MEVDISGEHHAVVILTKIILTDVDGVLVTWICGFNDLMSKKGYPRKIPVEYNLQKAFGVSKEVIDEVAFEYVTSDAIANLPPIKNSVKAIRYLHEKHGYVFHCITSISGHPKAHENRLKNLHNLYGKSAIYDLHCFDHNVDKKSILEGYRNEGHYWIEDHPENYEFGFDYGLNSLLVDQPWNVDYKERANSRIDLWDEVVKRIEA